MRTILLAAVLATGAVAGCHKDKAGAGEQAENLPTMSMDAVEKGIAANELTPVDCNGDKTRAKNGVLPGAILISDEETFVASELPADKGRKLVFYCSDQG